MHFHVHLKNAFQAELEIRVEGSRLATIFGLPRREGVL